jgi:hypothetical protein
MHRQQRIAELKAELARLEKVTPEERFLELIDGLTIKIDKEKHPDSIFFFRGEECHIEIRKSTIWFRYVGFWKVFEDEFGMDYQQIRGFLEIQLEEHFKMKGVTPRITEAGSSSPVEEHFKMKSNK